MIDAPAYAMLIDGEPGNFGGTFPDLPGCTTGADTIAELIANAPAVLRFHIDGIAEDGAVPPPSSIDALRADPAFAEDFASAIMVAVVEVA